MIGNQLRKAFTISNIGGYVLFKSTEFGFQLIWDRRQNLKIAVSNPQLILADIKVSESEIVGSSSLGDWALTIFTC